MNDGTTTVLTTTPPPPATRKRHSKRGKRLTHYQWWLVVSICLFAVLHGRTWTRWKDEVGVDDVEVDEIVSVVTTTTISRRGHNDEPDHVTPPRGVTIVHDDYDDDGMKKKQRKTVPPLKTFYILSLPETTSLLIGETGGGRGGEQAARQQAEAASSYYQEALNEESAESWLHRGFSSSSNRLLSMSRTHDPTKADVFLIVGYLHLYKHLHQKHSQQKKNAIDHTFVAHYKDLIVDVTKPHLVLIPSWNPKVSRQIGLQTLMKTLREVLPPHNLWSVGFERNPHWQGNLLDASKILPIPYVVNIMMSDVVDVDQQQSPPMSSLERRNRTTTTTTNNNVTTNNNLVVFYAGDRRRNAEAWAGCYRSQLLEPLMMQHQQPPSTSSLSTPSTTTPATITTTTQRQHPSLVFDVRLVDKKKKKMNPNEDDDNNNHHPHLMRLNQTEYNHRMSSSDYCLIVCGDTPTSRSLTSAMVAGCIPVFVGSRWNGLCEPPCHAGFGWIVTGPELPHLPFAETIEWHDFPLLNEQDMMLMGAKNNATNAATTTSSSSSSSSVDLLQGVLDDYTETKKKKQLQSVMSHMRPAFIYGYGDPVTSHEFGDAPLYIWRSFLAAAGLLVH